MITDDTARMRPGTRNVCRNRRAGRSSDRSCPSVVGSAQNTADFRRTADAACYRASRNGKRL